LIGLNAEAEVAGSMHRADAIVNIVAMSLQNGHQPRWQVFVELDLHARTGVAGKGRSSSADTAAKATTARTASPPSICR